MNDEIDYILETFNFERVHVAMTAIDWKWVNKSQDDCSVPTVAHLKQTAEYLLRTAAREKITTGTGGFQAKYYSPEGDYAEMLVLSFVLSEVNSEYYNDD